jgi:hypothetical protein
MNGVWSAEVLVILQSSLLQPTARMFGIDEEQTAGWLAGSEVRNELQYYICIATADRYRACMQRYVDGLN